MSQLMKKIAVLVFCTVLLFPCSAKVSAENASEKSADAITTMKAGQKKDRKDKKEKKEKPGKKEKTGKSERAQKVEQTGTIEVKPATAGQKEEIWLTAEGKKTRLLPGDNEKSWVKALAMNGKQASVKGTMVPGEGATAEPAIRLHGVTDPNAPKGKKSQAETKFGTLKILGKDAKNRPEMQLVTPEETYRLLIGKDQKTMSLLENCADKGVSIKGSILDKTAKFPLRAIRVRHAWEGQGPEPEQQLPKKREGKKEGRKKGK